MGTQISTALPSVFKRFDTLLEALNAGRRPSPTLVLWGEEDGWLTPDTADRLAAAIPGARRELIPAAGHFLPEDAPEATAAALLRFLD